MDPIDALTTIQAVHDTTSWHDFLIAKGFLGALLIWSAGTVIWVIASGPRKFVAGTCGLAFCAVVAVGLVALDDAATRREAAYASTDVECDVVLGAVRETRVRVLSSADRETLRAVCGEQSTLSALNATDVGSFIR